MRRATGFALVCAAALLLPATSGMANGKGEVKRLAVKECIGEKKADKAAFRAAYGTNGKQSAMRNCIRQTRPELRAERREAASECRAERREDVDAFREEYGTNNNKRNAFGKCVVMKLRAEVRQGIREFRNAAQACRAERSDDPESFRDNWGTNSPKGAKAQGAKRNAFGKCVRTTVRNGNGDGDDNGENGEEEENGESENGNGE